MTRYLLYFLTGVAIATVILFFRGYVLVPHTIYSDIALPAGMALFGLASWVTLFRIKLGSVLALLCVLAVVPWLVRIGLRVWSPDTEIAIKQVVQIIHLVLSVLLLFSGIVSARYLIRPGSWQAGTPTPGFVLKLILAAIPLAVVAGWLLVMPQV
ncbi:hypothetical protein [Pontibacter liquoris]|uniref:hypothetical protein n=1 Tax=Pontibacter liquoris TaxID=2905677 RepID=UPI001FA798FB|nr:hypothetical protein [Pontibacter liquoris]